jgi:hypothetical protein
MNLEFHYYVVHWLALKAGLDPQEARTIAHSSQYVDNAILGYRVTTPRGDYDTVITQNYIFWDEATMRNAYLPFHFVPSGDKGPSRARADRGANPFDVRPDSGPAKEILIAALKSRNAFRIGIALHCYADTWAHQNFSGLHEEWNRVDPGSPLPSAGHAQALGSPDQLSGVWQDGRLAGSGATVRNRERFLKAALKIYKYLRTYAKRDFDDAELVMDRLEGLWGPAGRERPMKERIMDYVIDSDMLEYDRSSWLREAGMPVSSDGSDSMAGYDKLKWLGRELAGRAGMSRRETVVADSSFFSSDFYAWCSAAAEHRSTAQAILKARGLLP